MPELMTQSPTMTSREIADLVESRHDKVKQSIERLAERGVIELPPTGEIPTATKPTTIYIREHGWDIGTANHPVYGPIHSYPRQAVALAFDQE